MENIKPKFKDRINKIRNHKTVNEFQEFLKEYKIVSVAVAFVMGQAVNDLVRSFVNDIFMPLLNPIIPSGEWQVAKVTIWKFTIGWGPFVSEFINFAILALIIFIVVKKLLTKAEDKPAS